MSKEAMKLALEALTKNSDRVTEMRARVHAITALREALAKQPAPVQQEPVAYIHRQGNHYEVSERFLSDDEKARGWTEEPLYTSPPAQPQRQPLTDEQKDAARYQHIKGMARAMSLDISGNHYWTVALHGIRGPSLDEAIDRAIEAAHNTKEQS